MTPIEYCSKLNNRDAEMVQMYWTQTTPFLSLLVMLLYKKLIFIEMCPVVGVQSTERYAQVANF